MRIVVPRRRTAMLNDPTRRPRERQNEDIEQDTGGDQRVPRRDGETERTVGPEDEDRRVRPGEKRPAGTMP
jgi:hypothetical protein